MLAGIWSILAGLYCELVLLAKYCRLLGAAADDSVGREHAGWQLDGSCGALQEAGSDGRTLEAVGCSC